jgi:membrane fusion protein, multidrug efflux system
VADPHSPADTGAPQQTTPSSPAGLERRVSEAFPDGVAHDRDEPAGDGLARRIVGHVLGAAIVAGAIVVGLYNTRLYYLYPRTDDAYVRANVVGVAPHVSGPIVELPVQDDQHVKRGELLFVVDPRPYKSVLDRAEANLELTNLQINALQDTIHASRERLVQQQADAAYDKQYVQRIEPLLSRHFITANDLFNARSRFDAAEAGVRSLQGELMRAQNELGQYGDINARRRAAEAAVYDARLNVNYCYVTAPFDAYVTNLNIAVGQYGNEGRQVLNLVDNRQWYVLANFRENFLGQIKPGMTAEIYLLSYPNRRFRGLVQGVGWALYQTNGATVEGLPDVEATLNWVRLSQRFPVRIVLDGRDPAFPFRMGSTAVVTIQGYRKSHFAAGASQSERSAASRSSYPPSP